MDMRIDLSELVSFATASASASSAMPGALRKAGTESGRLVEGVSRSTSPVDTGFLKGRIGMSSVTVGGDSVTVEIAANTDYAAAVHDGHRAFTIHAKKSVLVFPMDGKTIFTKSVNIPATSGNPWMADALASSAEQVSTIFAETIERDVFSRMGA